MAMTSATSTLFDSMQVQVLSQVVVWESVAPIVLVSARNILVATASQFRTCWGVFQFSSMSVVRRGAKRAPSTARSLASVSRVTRRRGVDGDVEGEEDIKNPKKGGNRRSLDHVLRDQATSKQLYPPSTQPCEMHAAPTKLASGTCQWGKCAFTKDALNFFIEFGFGVQSFFRTLCESRLAAGCL